MPEEKKTAVTEEVKKEVRKLTEEKWSFGLFLSFGRGITRIEHFGWNNHLFFIEKPARAITWVAIASAIWYNNSVTKILPGDIIAHYPRRWRSFRQGWCGSFIRS